MRKYDRWTQRLGVLVAIIAGLLQVQAALAQDPTPARAPVVEDDAEPRTIKRPARPGATATEGRRVPASQALQMGMMGTTSLVVEGDYVYLVYGGHLIQFTVDGLVVKSKVNLRELLRPQGAARRVPIAGEERPARGEMQPRAGREGFPVVPDGDTPAPAPAHPDTDAAPAERPDGEAAPEADAAE